MADIPEATGDCVPDMSETMPSSRFTPLEEGAVVRDEYMQLEWQRCAIGMDWDGTTCSGTTPTNYIWQEAMDTWETATWRLPTIHELVSIVEKCRTNPAINTQVFPNTPMAWFWSSSPYAGLANHAWGISFLSGRGGWRNQHLTSAVRLVRDAP